MKSIFGGLIEFETEEELNEFLEQVDKESALLIIEKCLEYCQRNGFFSLMESNIIYKSINKLKEK